MIDSKVQREAARPTAAPNARRRHPGKAALGRAKLAAVAVSVVAFVGTLAGISQLNPGTAKAGAGTPASQAPVAQAASIPRFNQEPTLIDPGTDGGTSSFVLPARPQAPVIRPFARTRGS